MRECEFEGVFVLTGSDMFVLKQMGFKLASIFATQTINTTTQMQAPSSLYCCAIRYSLFAIDQDHQAVHVVSSQFAPFPFLFAFPLHF